MTDAGGARQHLGRVLVADDDEAIRRVCTRILSHEGWHVTTAESGRHAIAETERAAVPFDCVLSDVNMPEMDGFELVRTLREKDDDLPVLLMTGDPSLDGAVRAIDTGAVSYIAKPFDHESLASQVARAARRHGVQRMRRRAESWARELFGETRELGRIETRFASAIASSWMAFQPIVDVTRHTIFAYEALLRTDEESMRRPDIFISTAERLDKVQLLGRRVRDSVARAAQSLPEGASVFVNVHGLELNDEELFSAQSALAAIAPRVVLEITERTGIDPAAGPTRVAMLRRLGYRIAVDDLGAGYAALGALATLEPDIVKLDMSLIRDLDRHDKKRRIVTAIASLCRELGGRVVAEGVETLAEKQACIDAGIELVQGYFYARPSRGFASVTF
ncbi:MAG TPA: EAL domain-containing protein [Kofleriaceae bacterium]|jgi:EAL domain-containing protein (putative c-di-GMP-specific phosphodiesterase class I)